MPLALYSVALALIRRLREKGVIDDGDVQYVLAKVRVLTDGDMPGVENPEAIMWWAQHLMTGEID